jgi:hypothetical protein
MVPRVEALRQLRKNKFLTPHLLKRYLEGLGVLQSGWASSLEIKFSNPFFLFKEFNILLKKT